MESYLLKSNLAIVILYVLYRYISKYEANHQLNRLLGLFLLVFSFGILFIPLDGFFGSFSLPENLNQYVIQTYPLQPELIETTNSNSFNLFIMIYWIGVGAFTLRSLAGMITPLRYYLQSSKHQRWGFRVVAVKDDISPFTFFNMLFLGNQKLDEKEREVLLVHEQVHRDQFHSIDALILEFMTVFCWFNPAIWFLQRDIRASHEFLADAHVLKKGIPELEYQHLLFKSKTGVSIHMGNYFSRKPRLSLRFKMMKHRKINVHGSIRRVIASVCVMAVMMSMSAFIDAQTISNVDVPAVYEGGNDAMYKSIASTIKYPKSARDENRSGTVYVSFTVDAQGEVQGISTNRKNGEFLEQIVVVGYSKSTEEAKGVNADIEKEAMLAVDRLGKFRPAEKEGKAVSSVLVLPIQFKLD